MRKTLLYPIVCCLLLVSCANDAIFTEFHPIAQEGWNHDSVCTFSFHIDDTTLIYQLRMHVNHRETYPYQNIWLFVDDSARTEMPHDTLLYYLANDRGEWLGHGKNGVVEMPMIYQQERHFRDTGNYTINIRHGMRDTILRGVDNVGFEVLKYEQE